jgi:hypothetical protein
VSGDIVVETAIILGADKECMLWLEHLVKPVGDRRLEIPCIISTSAIRSLPKLDGNRQ